MVVDAEHVAGRVAERAGLHVVVHGHRAVDPGAAERLGRERHGGSISLAPREGGGTEASVILPLSFADRVS